MFTLAMEAKARGRGVVGSTSNILDFISANVAKALEQPFLEPLQVSLGFRALGFRASPTATAPPMPFGSSIENRAHDIEQTARL